MRILAASLIGIAVYLFIVLVFRRRGEYRDTIRRRLDTVGSAQKKPFVTDEDISKPFMERIFKPLFKSMTVKLVRPGKKDESPEKSRQAGRLRKMLAQAGFGFSTAEYGVIRLFVILLSAAVFCALALALGAAASGAFFGAAVGFFTGYVLMRFVLTRSITKRKRRMEKQLPDVLDLLSVSVEAGLGFEQAVHHITTNMEGPLIDELTVTYREMAMGRTRKDALTLLGQRCELEEIKAFVSALVQATQLGISMKNVLRSQAAAMRQARKAKVQEKAMKVSVKMLFPMVLFIFPVIFIILLGPAVVNVLKAFQG
jgi:tight adherence protein C